MYCQQCCQIIYVCLRTLCVKLCKTARETTIDKMKCYNLKTQQWKQIALSAYSIKKHNNDMNISNLYFLKFNVLQIQGPTQLSCCMKF